MFDEVLPGDVESFVENSLNIDNIWEMTMFLLFLPHSLCPLMVYLSKMRGWWVEDYCCPTAKANFLVLGVVFFSMSGGDIWRITITKRIPLIKVQWRIVKGNTLLAHHIFFKPLPTLQSTYVQQSETLTLHLSLKWPMKNITCSLIFTMWCRECLAFSKL